MVPGRADLGPAPGFYISRAVRLAAKKQARLELGEEAIDDNVLSPNFVFFVYRLPSFTSPPIDNLSSSIMAEGQASTPQQGPPSAQAPLQSQKLSDTIRAFRPMKVRLAGHLRGLGSC
jgi:hypothetical protein